MSVLRAIIDAAVADAIAEHPKYFTPRGLEHARTVIVRKVMAALRDGGDKASGPSGPEPASPPQPTQPVLADPQSREARAFANLRLVAGAGTPFRTGDGRVSIPPQASGPDVLAFADLPPKTSWLFVSDRKQMGAWVEFFGHTLPNVPRRSITEHQNGMPGFVLPWPWPPRKDGTTYTNAEDDAA